MKCFSAFLANAALWAGIILPLFTLAFEMQTHACAAEHFDPIPTWGHVLLVALVPAAIFGVWLAGRGAGVGSHGFVTALHGAALAPLLLHLLALGPLNVMACAMLPFAALMLFGAQGGGIMVFMLVLATLGPLAGMIGWIIAAVRLRRVRTALSPEVRRRSRRVGLGALLAGAAAVAVVEWPLVRTYEALRVATFANALASVRAAAIESLRTSRREDFLLRLCYADSRATTVGAFGPLARIFTPEISSVFGVGRGGLETRSFDVDALRGAYFRVTGRVFTDQPPPRLRQWRMLGSRVAEDGRFSGLAWDEARGGESVGARLRGLSLAASRMDWHVDKASALAHGEWTLEFRNTHANAQEARCQMLLPPRACVSRLTLWINDEPREAAFGAKAQVREAYRQTVVVDRRDPVLVNMTGPDRVLTQCFPVPANGTMKIRLGITAPCDGTVGNKLAMPLFLERNFSVPPSLMHSVWAQADAPLRTSLAEANAVQDKQGQWTWQNEVPDAGLSALSFACDSPPVAKTWTEDPFAAAGEGKFLVREIRPTEQPPPAHVIAVVDGSEQMRPHAATIVKALQGIPTSQKVTAILSTDHEPAQFDREAIASRITPHAFRGGRDSMPALKLALRLARESNKPAVIIWLHGPQPWKSDGVSGLEQLIERAVEPPAIQTVCLAHGPNRVLEQLYQSTVLRGESRWDGSEAGLKTLLADACSVGLRPAHEFTRAAEPPSDGAKVWDQMARHFVFEEVLAAFRGQSRVPDAHAKRAARYQLVTPYSGAVVLETQAQYERAGLKPVDASTTPLIPGGVPEPSRMILLLVGLGSLLMRRRR